MAEVLRIGIAGLGTVGSAVARLLGRNGELIAVRTGRRPVVTAVSARDRAKDRGIDLSRTRFLDDPTALATDPEVDLVCELIGGEDGPALDLARRTLSAGRPLVTANKALLAHHGADLATLAEENGAALAFEAAVAGGIPIVKALREGLAANRIERIYGILNGTCNYILTAMSQSGRDFDEVLAEAMALGYAEADPSFDVDGIDAAHKLALLSAVAFGGRPDFAGITVEGIRHITALDIAFAKELGYRIKLLGLARLTEHGLEQRVHPTMVPEGAPIASVDGVLNAVGCEADPVGLTMYEGRGAGGGPTASAVVADICDIARGERAPAFGLPASALEIRPAAPLGRHHGAYYIRLMVLDRPGVLAEIAACLRDHQVSIEAVIQRSRNPGQAVPIVITSHPTTEAAMTGALSRIGTLAEVVEPPRMIRIETF